MIENATLNSTFFGLEFLPVERRTYIKIQSILRRFELIYSSMKTIILSLSRSNHLVKREKHQSIISSNDLILFYRSGLTPDDTMLLYSIFRRYYWINIKTLPHTSTWRYE